MVVEENHGNVTSVVERRAPIRLFREPNSTQAFRSGGNDGAEYGSDVAGGHESYASNGCRHQCAGGPGPSSTFNRPTRPEVECRSGHAHYVQRRRVREVQHIQRLARSRYVADWDGLGRRDFLVEQHEGIVASADAHHAGAVDVAG